MAEKIKIRVPQPEPGFNTAKVVVKTRCGNSLEDVTYTYLDVCLEPQPPRVNAVDEISTDNIEDAYSICLDEIADLFCDPVFTPPEQGSPPITVITLPRIEQLEILGEPFIPGSFATIRYRLSGQGSYALSVVGEQEPLASGPIIETVTNSFQYEIPLETEIGQAIRFGIVARDPNGENRVQDFRDIIITSIAPPPAPKELLLDNDISDAKKELYILSSSLVNINIVKEQYINAFLPTRRGIFQPENKFREAIGSFWIKDTEDSNKIIFARNLNRTLVEPSSVELIVETDKIGFSQEGDFGYLKEKIRFNTIFPVSNRESLIPTSPILDVLYTYQKPYTFKESTSRDLLFNSLILDTRPHYNFYNKKYEEIHFDITESVLPNMYYILYNEEMASQITQTNVADDLDPLLTDSLDLDIKKLLYLNDKISPSTRAKRINSYYDFYVKNYAASRVQDPQLLQRSRRIIIPFDFLEKLEGFNSKMSLFPQYIDIKFDTDPFEIVGSLLNQTYFGQQFVLNCISKFIRNDADVEILSLAKQEYDSSLTNLFASSNRYIDMTSILNINNEVVDEFIYLGDYKNYNKIVSNVSREQEELENIKNNLSNIIRTYGRTFKDIIDGKKCYKETLFYKISKYDSDPDTSEPLQEIYIPNDTSKDYLRYIDTQVKYNKQYTYRITSYDFVIANEYYRQEANVEPLLQIQHSATIRNNVKLLIVENLFDEFAARVADKPPVYPQVDMHTYKDVDNQLLLLFNKNTINLDLQEIPIFEDDANFFANVRRVQNLNENELIKFGGDDIIKKYQIFRTNIPPNSYSDFANSTLIEVDTKIKSKDTNARIAAQSYVDNIRPNQKYYYTFRNIDIHDQISNPSQVYEVEIRNESGAVFPIINHWNFPERAIKQPDKQAKRFIMIKPNALQSFLDVSQLEVDNQEQIFGKLSTLGIQDETVWNKRYKLRLVSKNTKKVYDIVFKFDLKKEKIE